MTIWEAFVAVASCGVFASAINVFILFIIPEIEGRVEANKYKRGQWVVVVNEDGPLGAHRHETFIGLYGRIEYASLDPGFNDMVTVVVKFAGDNMSPHFGDNMPRTLGFNSSELEFADDDEVITAEVLNA